MPDLSDLLGTNTVDLMLNLVFGGRGIYERPGRLYLVNLARVVDKTLREYASAREKLEQFVIGGRPINALLETTSHLETCIDSLLRAIRYLDRLKRDQATTLGKHDLLRPAEQHTVRSIRHAIQHTDEWIAQRKIDEGDAISVLPLNESLRIADEEITYLHLADVIRRVHRVTRQLIAIKPEA